MSNKQHNTPQRKKVIGLKPIVFPSQEIDQEDDQAKQVENLVDQVESAKQQLADIQHEMDQKKKQTEEQIAQAQERWLSEKQILIEEAKKTGFEEGFQQGEEKAEQTFKDKLMLADQIIATAEKERVAIIDQGEPVILTLAMKVASKIIGYEVRENDAFINMVKEAIQDAQNQPSVKVQTSTNQFEFVRDRKEQLMSVLEPDVSLTIYPSDKLNDGDCIIETPYSRLDVSIDQQLNKIRTGLMELMEEINRGHQ
ncbi:flagellar assembly protein FliH [Amphibacillus cookii]|uniref:flagellar assembly protein FliH n=1 Tax=Amphibacillus cookii TaxID=767787 RepID=UPI001958B515|nr:flagellar assembly protein FliH [Amphibacillus cookii]